MEAGVWSIMVVINLPKAVGLKGLLSLHPELIPGEQEAFKDDSLFNLSVWLLSQIT